MQNFAKKGTITVVYQHAALKLYSPLQTEAAIR